jgi:hypothetical protein
MKETAAAEINVCGRLRWVAMRMNDLGARDPAISNSCMRESLNTKKK